MTQIFWTIVPEKTQCGKTGVAREDFIIQQFFNTTRCQTGLPIERNNSPTLLPIPLSARMTFAWLSNPLHHPFLDRVSPRPLCFTHAGPTSDLAVFYCLCVCLKIPASASPASVLISSGWYRLYSPYLLPPDCSPYHWFIFSANLAPEIELTGLPQCVLQVTLKPSLILFSLTNQRLRLSP